LKRAHRFALLLLVLTTVGCDRVTKHAATTWLAGTPARSYLANTVRFEYAENPGAFLGLGTDLPPEIRSGALAVATLLIMAGVIVAAIRLHGTLLPLVGLSLIFAGGLSNGVDRVTRGRTVDFLNLGVGSLRTGIFNVADVAIMAGIAIVFCTYRWKGKGSET